MTVFEMPTDWKSSNWWRNRSVEERLFHAKIPKRLALSLTSGNSCAQATANWMCSYEPGSSLYITGRSGVGKSTTAADALSQLLTKFPVSGRFVTSDTYLEMLKDQFGDSDNLLPSMYSSPHLVKYIQGVFDVVVLDGVGQERETEFASHELGSLLRRRSDDMRTTIVTSSLSTADFSRRYGERVKGVINEMSIIRLS
jgi:DNA replication protein DnaC